MSHVYKLMPAKLWQDFQRSARFIGSPDDIRDGYIHLSTAAQVLGTYQKYFADQQDVYLLTISINGLATDLRYEASRGNQLFPHLYRPLALAEVTCAVMVDAAVLSALEADA